MKTWCVRDYNGVCDIKNPGLLVAGVSRWMASFSLLVQRSRTAPWTARLALLRWNKLQRHREELPPRLAVLRDLADLEPPALIADLEPPAM
jgi:hypothetical protein